MAAGFGIVPFEPVPERLVAGVGSVRPGADCVHERGIFTVIEEPALDGAAPVAGQIGLARQRLSLRDRVRVARQVERLDTGRAALPVDLPDEPGEAGITVFRQRHPRRAGRAREMSSRVSGAPSSQGAWTLPGPSIASAVRARRTT